MNLRDFTIGTRWRAGPYPPQPDWPGQRRRKPAWPPAPPSLHLSSPKPAMPVAASADERVEF